MVADLPTVNGSGPQKTPCKGHKTPRVTDGSPSTITEGALFGADQQCYSALSDRAQMDHLYGAVGNPEHSKGHHYKYNYS